MCTVSYTTFKSTTLASIDEVLFTYLPMGLIDRIYLKGVGRVAVLGINGKVVGYNSDKPNILMTKYNAHIKELVHLRAVVLSRTSFGWVKYSRRNMMKLIANEIKHIQTTHSQICALTHQISYPSFLPVAQPTEVCYPIVCSTHTPQTDIMGLMVFKINSKYVINKDVYTFVGFYINNMFNTVLPNDCIDVSKYSIRVKFISEQHQECVFDTEHLRTATVCEVLPNTAKRYPKDSTVQNPITMDHLWSNSDRDEEDPVYRKIEEPYYP